MTWKKTSINGPLWLIGHYSLLLIKQDNKKHLWNFWSRCDSHTYIFLASFFYINKLFICWISCSMAKKWSMITRMISLWKESVTRTHQSPDSLPWQKGIWQNFAIGIWEKYMWWIRITRSFSLDILEFHTQRGFNR